MQTIKSIKTGEGSSVIPMTYGAPYYVVSHGNKKYNFTSYGVHLGQEDHLIFLGKKKKIRAKFVDFRKNSPTLHKKVEIDIEIAPDKKLIIPPGIAHAFNGLENVYTLNRSKILLSDTKEYIPSNDTYDWDIKNENYPIYQPNDKLADDEYYELLAEVQSKELYSKKTNEAVTPFSLYTKDKHGSNIRVLLREEM